MLPKLITLDKLQSILKDRETSALGQSTLPITEMCYIIFIGLYCIVFLNTAEKVVTLANTSVHCQSIAAIQEPSVKLPSNIMDHPHSPLSQSCQAH